MPTKNFRNDSLDKLIDAEDTVDNLNYIETLSSYEFVFMDMTDFRMYRTFFDRKDKEFEECPEVKPIQILSTKYVLVKDDNFILKTNEQDYHGALR